MKGARATLFFPSLSFVILSKKKNLSASTLFSLTLSRFVFSSPWSSLSSTLDVPRRPRALPPVPPRGQRGALQDPRQRQGGGTQGARLSFFFLFFGVEKRENKNDVQKQLETASSSDPAGRDRRRPGARPRVSRLSRLSKGPFSARSGGGSSSLQGEGERRRRGVLLLFREAGAGVARRGRKRRGRRRRR